MANITESDFLVRSHAVLRPHIETLQRNRLLRGIQSMKRLAWKTGEPPTDLGEMMILAPQNDIADTLRDMATHARRLMTELQLKKRYGDFGVMLAFFDLMRRWGADPDPGGTLRRITGYMAEGPEISIEDVIQLRYASQLNVLDLRRLPVTNGNLAAIPVEVSHLALADTSVTDEGMEQLLRLQRLSRVNLAGTKITDDGLQELAKLPNLEWVCVNRTQVTAAGVDRLKGTRPDVTVMIGSEP
jgi:hypothetical protein